MDVFDGLSGRVVDSRVAEGADRLLKTKAEKGLWPAIEECIRIWKGKNPEEWQSYLFYLKDIKTSRKTPLAHSKDSRGRYLRYVVDVPQQVVKMIRVLYPPEDLKMDIKFWTKFGKKFREFMIPEKY